MRRLDLRGVRFSKLVAVSQARHPTRGHILWRCVCDCGAETFASVGKLRSGQKKSCGCSSSTGGRRVHGLYGTKAHRLFEVCRDRARKKGIPFTLEISDIVVPEVCPILGIPLSQENRNNWPSVDRVNPALGYIPGNVVVISYRANRIKNDASLEELEAIVAYVKMRMFG